MSYVKCTHEEIMYEAADYEELKNMSKAEVAEILNGLEDSWIPRRPGAYYSGDDMDESDFWLLKCVMATKLAAKWLKEQARLEDEKCKKQR